MVTMNCSVCQAGIYSCPYNHGYVNSSNLPGLIVCSTCIANGRFLLYVKSMHSLIERSLYNQENYNKQVAQAALEKFKTQATFNDVVIFGLLVNDATKGLAAKFVDLKDMLIKEESGMKRRLEESVENILVGTEKAVNKVIIDEVASLVKFIEKEDAVNQKNVGRVEQMRNDMMKNLRDLHKLDMEDRSIGKVFTNEEINAIVQELNKKINFFNNKHTSLNTLTKEGQKILTYGRIEKKEKNQQGEIQEALPLVENGAA